MVDTVSIQSSDKSTSREISCVEIEGSAVWVKGKIMGAIPLRASISPAELRKLVALVGVGMRNIFRIVWMLVRGSGGAKAPLIS